MLEKVKHISYLQIFGKFFQISCQTNPSTLFIYQSQYRHRATIYDKRFLIKMANHKTNPNNRVDCLGFGKRLTAQLARL
jgi:hypothetical protein